MKPRFRVLTSGWVRHNGDSKPCVLGDFDPVNIIVRNGNASFVQGFAAIRYEWRHRGFSGDIVYWRPAT
jgi:hypothetical protein